MADNLIPLICPQCAGNDIKTIIEVDDSLFRIMFEVEHGIAILRAGQSLQCQHCKTKFLEKTGFNQEGMVCQVTNVYFSGNVNTGGGAFFGPGVTIIAGGDVALGAKTVGGEEVQGTRYKMTGNFRNTWFTLGNVECPQCGHSFQFETGMRICPNCRLNLPRSWWE